MNKTEFLQALEAGLSSASPDERVAAMQYYTEYLDDAGPDREAEAINELGSPQKIAADILGASSASAESWTPPQKAAPTADTKATPSFEAAPEEPANTSAAEANTGAAPEPEAPRPHKGSFSDMPDPPTYGDATGGYNGPGHGGQQSNRGYAPPPIYDQPAGGQNQYNTNHYNTKNNNLAKIILIVLVAIVLFPVIGGGFAVLAGLLIAFAVLMFCPVIIGIALILAGIGVVVAGALLIPIFMGAGLLFIGGGVFLIGIGLIASYLGGKLMSKGIGAIFGGVFGGLQTLFNKIFHRAG